MRRVKVKGEKPAKEALKDAAAILFGEYGYVGTSVRMIADEAGYSAGQITKCFESKENLFNEIVQDIYLRCCVAYDPIIDEYRSLKFRNMLNEEKIWELVERIIDTQIDFAFNEDRRIMVRILWVHQYNVETSASSKLLSVTKDKIENVMAELLREVFKQKRILHCLTISRAVNGSIISFAEHPSLLLDDLVESKFKPNSIEWAKEYLKKFLMNALKHEAEVSE